MSKKLEAFKKANKPNSRSALSVFSNELFELKNEGYTQQQMLHFLNENGVKTTKQNLSAFLARATKNKNLKGVKNEEKKVEKPSPALLEDDSLKILENDTKKSDESQNRANTIDPRFAKMLGLENKKG